LLKQASSVAARPNFGAAADTSGADGPQILLLIRPALTLLPVTGWAIIFGDPVSLFRRAADANHDFVVSLTRARVVAVDNDLAPAIRLRLSRRRGSGKCGRKPGRRC
jgi:hypothetical protein